MPQRISERLVSRVCRKCKTEKPIADFLVWRRSSETTAVTCSACRPEVNAEQRLRRNVRTAHHRALTAGRVSTLTIEEWRQILSVSNGECAYCHRNVSVDYLTIEHIVPVNKGGDNTAANITATCWQCNASKAQKAVATFSPPLMGRPRKAAATPDETGNSQV
jgi:5-methylcytosine-specific restriction endonuclease McrA